MNYCKILWDFLGAVVVLVAPVTIGFLIGRGYEKHRPSKERSS